MRQLEKQRRRLESRGIFKDLATLRVQWEEKRKALLENPADSGRNPVSENSFNDIDDLEDEDDDDLDDEDDEIDVENDEEDGTSGNDVIKPDANRKPHSAFSIDNLLSHALQKTKQDYSQTWVNDHLHIVTTCL